MSFCFLYNIVSENHSAQNSPLGVGQGGGRQKPAQDLIGFLFYVYCYSVVDKTTPELRTKELFV